MSHRPPVHVTRPYLPDLAEFLPYLEQIWESRVLTNAGPFHARLERELCAYLGVDHISLFSNGTLALVTAAIPVTRRPFSALPTPTTCG